MKLKIRFLYLLTAFIICTKLSTPLYASHISGGEIVYECLGNNEYVITLNLFKDCFGVALGNTQTIKIESSCGSPAPLTLGITNPGGTEISQLCPSDIPNSTCNSGYLPGMELYTYQDTVTIPNPCSDWTFSWTSCCRNSAIINLASAASQSSYFQATLNNQIDSCNSSPRFTAQPIPFVCANQQVIYNYGVYETEGDSLSFSLIAATGTSATNYLNYNAPYSAANPINGITLDPATGQLVFTPTVVGNFVVVILVKEYNDNNVLIGTTMRDIQFVVQACSNAVPSDTGGAITNLTGDATLLNPFSLEMCDGGSFSFDVQMTDPDTADMVSLLSNVTSVFPGATFTSTAGNPATASVSWTAPGGVSYFNSFVINAEDDACPVTGIQTFVYEVRVLLSTVIQPKNPRFCKGGVPVKLVATGGSSFTWTDISGGAPVNLSCDTCAITYASPDSTTTYVVTSDLISSNCVNTDTVTVVVVPPFTQISGQDTLLCLTLGIQLTVNHNAGSDATYRWQPGKYLSDSTIANPIATPDTNTTFYVYVTSDTGCTKVDSLQVFASNPVDLYVLSTSTSLCYGDTIQLEAVVSNSVVEDDFDPGTDMTQWSSISGGGAGVSCGSMSGNALYFNGGGTRSATTNDLNVPYGGTISFSIFFGTYAFAPCQDADLGEDVTLEYSTNGGGSWTTIEVYKEYNYSSFTKIIVSIPPSAQTSSTRFRWRQYTFSGIAQDNWALDDVMIISLMAGSNAYTYNWTPSIGLSDSTISNPLAFPSSTTTYSVTVIDTVSTCVYTNNITLSVSSNFSIATSNNTRICTQGENTMLKVVHNAGAGATIDWSPGMYLSDSTITSPLAFPTSTTTFYVAVISDSGCVKTDSINVEVLSITSFDVTPDNGFLCIGDSLQLNTLIKSMSCTIGNSCQGSTDSIDVGTGTFTSSSYLVSPFVGLYTSSKRQILYTASELNALGMSQGSAFEALAFNISFVNGASYENFTIKMGCTSISSLTSTFETGLQTVFFPKNITLSTGWFNLTFDNTYSWDGVSSIIIEFCYENSASSSSSSTYYTWVGTSVANYVVGYTPLCNSTTGTITTYRPNLRFRYCSSQGGSNFTYLWTPGAGLNDSTIANPVASPSIPTSFYLTATDTSSGCIYTDSVLVKVGGNFTVSASDDTTLCSLKEVPINAIHNTDSNATYNWTPGNLVSDSTIANPIAYPNNSMTFYINVTSDSGCIETDSVRLDVLSIADFNVIPDNGFLCIGDSLQLNTSIEFISCTIGGSCQGVTDSAEVDSGIFASTSYLVSPFAGSYTSSKRQLLYTASELNSLGMSQGSSFDALAFNILTVNGSSYENFTIKMGCTSISSLSSTFETGLQTVFSPKNITLSTGWFNLTFDNTYSWDGISNIIIEFCYENSAASSSSSTYYTWVGTSVANYVVGYTPLCNSTTGTITTYRPNLRFRYCSSQGGSNFTYLWTPGSELSDSTIANPVASPSIPTSFYLTATDTSSGCIYTDSVLVKAGDNFTVTASNDTSLCSLKEVPISAIHNTDSNATYNWTPGNLVSDSTIANPIAYPNNSMIFYINVTSDSGCIETDSVRLNVLSIADFNVIPDNGFLCIGDSLQLNTSIEFISCTIGGSCQGVSDSIDVGTGTFASSSYLVSPFVGTYTSSKRQILYTASELNALGMNQGNAFDALAFNILTVNGASYENFTIKMGCTSISTLTSTFETGLQTVFFPKNITLSSGWNTFNFDNTYSWDGISNIIIEICYENPAVSTSSSSYYTWVGTDVANYVIGYSPLCNSTTGTITTYRPNLRLRYCSSQGGSNFTYSWTPTTGLDNSTIPNPIASPSAPTNYYLTATDTTTGCIYNDSVLVKAGGNFSVSVSNDTSLCSTSGIPISITHNTDSNATYNWSPGILVSDSTIANPIASPLTTTTFYISVTSDSGCIETDSVNITVQGIINLIVAASDTSLCLGDTVQLSSSQEPTTCSGYDVATITYAPISGSGTTVTLTDESVSAALPIGFSFEFFCDYYTEFYISSNGFISFSAGEGEGCCDGQSIPNATSPNNLIAFNWTDLDPDMGGTIEYFTTGSSPNQILVINFTNVPTFNTNIPTTIQLLLYEKSNIIEIHTGSAIYDGNLVTMGIENSTGSSAYFVAGRNASVWSSSNEGKKFSPTINKNVLYNWSPGSWLSDPTITNPYAYPPSNIIYTVTANDTITGCSVQDSIRLYVSAEFTVSTSNDTTICYGDSVQLVITDSAGVNLTYNWTPAVTLSDSSIFNPVATPISTTNYVVAAVSDLGCTKTDSINIEVIPLPNMVLTAIDTTICAGDTTQLNAIQSIPNCNDYRISTISYNPISGSGVTVSLGVDDILSNALPIDFSFDFFCNSYSQFYISDNGFITFSAGQLGNFSDDKMLIPDTTSPNNLIAFAWEDFNPEKGGSINYFTTGTAPDRMLIINFDSMQHFLSGNAATVQVILYETTNIIEIHTLSIPFSGGPQTQGIENRDGSIAYFVSGRNASNWSASSEGIRIAPYSNQNLSYNWIPTSGLSDNSSSNPMIYPDTTTLYILTSTDTTIGCYLKNSIQLNVNIPFNISVSNDTTACFSNGLALKVNHIPAIVPVTYNWTPYLYLSDSSIYNPVINTDTTLTFYVNVVDTAGCFSQNDSVSVTLSIPVITLTNDTFVCIGDSIQLLASGGLNYQWSPMVGLNDSSSSSPIANPILTTTYIATIIDTIGCQASDSLVLTVYSLPTISIINDTFTCLGDSIQLVASGGSQYQWSPATGLSSTNLPSPMANPDSLTTYLLNVMDTMGCQNKDSVTLSIRYLPSIYLGEDTSICMGESVTFNAGSGFYTYQWQDNSTGTSFTANTKGQYWIRVTNYCGPMSDTINILSINPLPIINLGIDTAICYGTIHTLIAGESSSSFLWSTGDTTSTINIDTIGKYYVTVKDTNLCINVDSISIDINALPIVNLGNDTAICDKTSISLNADSGLMIYSWSTGDNTSSIIVDTIGQYIITITDNNLCINSDTINISINPLTFLNLGIDTSICNGTTYTVDAGNNFTSYLWSSGDTSRLLSISNSGQYYVTVIDSNTCSNSDTISIGINDLPIVDIGDNTTICSGTYMILNATSTNSTYLWQDFSSFPTFTVEDSGLYWVEVTNQYFCITIDSIRINKEECEVNIPNVFSPNNDGINDLFIISGITNDGWELSIYNRWGELIFFTEYPMGVLWDGRTSFGKEVPDGVYYYLLENETKQENHTGYIRLLR